MLVTAREAQDIAQIIRDHHTALVAILYGQKAVPKTWWERGVKLGLIDPTQHALGVLAGMYDFGALLAALDDPSLASGMPLEAVKERLAAQPIPRTPLEERAAQAVLARGAQAVVGLGNKVEASTGATLVNADHAQEQDFKALIRDVVASNRGDKGAADRMRSRTKGRKLDKQFFEGAFRGTVKRMASDLGHASGDWARDLQRIAHTENHTAIQEGQADRWREQLPGRRILVYRAVRPDACVYCRRLYTDRGNPRIFELDKLEANGPDNRGRKAAEWEPVNGSTHPFCSCMSVRFSQFIKLPRNWKHGDAAPAVLGPGGYVL